MRRSTAGRYAFAILVALPFLPVCAFVLNGAPVVVFSIGAACFVIGVLLLVGMFAITSVPKVCSPPEIKPLRFTIGDLICLTTFLAGITIFLVSGFNCEAAERASRPAPLPAVVLTHYFWEMESGLVFVTIGGLIWILKRQKT
jgi:hypothetical protein